MTQHTSDPSHFRRSAGVGLVTAIFLLVVLAGLSVAMVTLFTTQQASAALDEQGERAYQAARAGVEYGLFQQFQSSNCPTNSTTFALPPNTSLSSFSVTVTCQLRYGAAGDPLARYFIKAVACNQPLNGACAEASATNNPDYVARKIEVEI